MTEALKNICSVSEAAEILGVTAERVGQFIRQERIAAKLLGRDWAIDLESVRAFNRQPRHRQAETVLTS